MEKVVLTFDVYTLEESSFSVRLILLVTKCV